MAARRIAAEIDGADAAEAFPGFGYCMLEAGESMAGLAFGNFFAEPSPQVKLRHIGSTWHWGKVLFELWWLTPYGVRREALRQTQNIGARSLGIPISF